LRNRLAARRIALEVDDHTLDLIAERGYDPVYGARPLKRVIQTDLADPLATKILEGAIHEGETVQTKVTDGAIELVAT
jgi:ATP-dependent Clp protease ATP-binding subunit ClpB